MCKGVQKGFDAQFYKNINGVRTDFVFQRFTNKWFLLITQYGKVCNFFTVCFDVKDEAIPAIEAQIDDDPHHHISVPITVTNNFGESSDEIHSAIQFLVNKSNLGRCPTEFVISIGLKEINGKNLREIANVLDEVIS